MDAFDRYLTDDIAKALGKKMVFLAGPRQVGKTTLALSMLGEDASARHPAYLNWDDPLVPPRLKKKELPIDQKLLVLDEIHKYRNWRNLVKGIYDTEGDRIQILVTGSARLDYYRKGGDSLVNRYRYFRLHPLSLCELNPNAPLEEDLDRLLRFSGFPEPFFAADETEHRIWQRDRLSRVIRDDLRDLENVRSIDRLEQLVALLPEKVGSPLSIKSLRTDLEADHKTVLNWLQMLENLYICFRIPPFGGKRIRAVKKEQKLYLWDWTSVDDDGARFENLVAAQLLKYCHYIEDTKGYKMELRFLRDTDKREVDFVVIQSGEPRFAVECKSGDKAFNRNLFYFAERTDIPQFYQVHRGTRSFRTGPATAMPFTDFCRRLDMP